MKKKKEEKVSKSRGRRGAYIDAPRLLGCASRKREIFLLQNRLMIGPVWGNDSTNRQDSLEL